MGSPIDWIAPENLDEHAPGLGCPMLEGTTHTVLYDPKPSKANVDEGGDGKYESLFHGTFSHGPRYIRLGNRLVIAWSNHTIDEGGPGSRRLGRTATISDDEEDIDFGGDENVFELIPPCGPVYRRPWKHDGKVLRPYSGGGLSLINGSFYVQGSISAIPGFTTDEKYRHFVEVLPDSAYNEELDEAKGFVFDMWVNLGLSFVQKWKLTDAALVPDSPMYKRSEYAERYEITAGRFMEVAPLLAPYADAEPFENAPESMKDDILNGRPTSFDRSPKYAPETAPVAADGIDALAHMAEFQRPDGKWVVLRDNLLNKRHFYAALKDNADDVYPPAHETNMIAGANPECGELPDGRPWIVYNTFDDHVDDLARCRKDVMITISDDGITFDKTWLLHRVDRETDGGIYKMGGPQYFKSLLLGSNLWVFYSITKVQIGVTKIPLDVLD